MSTADMDDDSKRADPGQILAFLGKEIRLSFDKLFQSHLGSYLEGYLTAAWEYELERFSLWTDNLGLHHPGHNSLDYQLREAAPLRSIISSVLGNLKSCSEDRESTSISSNISTLIHSSSPIVNSYMSYDP